MTFMGSSIDWTWPRKNQVIETSQINMHRGKKMKNMHTHTHIREYPKSMGKSGKSIIRIPERKNCE